MTTIESIKSLLGIDENKQIETIVNLTESRLRVLLGVDEIPSKLEYILIEVSIVRYNKIGSEGVTTHNVEGESMTFSDNDFGAFKEDIQMWRDEQEAMKKGRIRFL